MSDLILETAILQRLSVVGRASGCAIIYRDARERIPNLEKTTEIVLTKVQAEALITAIQTALGYPQSAKAA